MPITFMYNGKQYTTNELNKKLIKMGITENDIKICKKQDCAIGEPDRDKKLYRFYNRHTGETIVSIYPDLNNLMDILEI